MVIMDSGLLACAQPRNDERIQMSEIHETIEKAQEGEHSQFFNRRIALLIAVLALFLSFSETLGKSAQTEAIAANVESSDLWAFFQAKSTRLTQLNTAAEEMLVSAQTISDPAVKDAAQRQIEAWKKTARNWPSAPRKPRTSAISRWPNTTTMSSVRQPSRSASCWLRPR